MVLARLTEQTELCVGTGFDGRSYDELSEAMGLFAKHLPLTYHLSETASSRELAQQIEAQLREAQKWQEYFSWENWHPDASNDAEAFCPFGFEYLSLPQPWQAGPVRVQIETQTQMLDRHTVSLTCLERGNELLMTLSADQRMLSPEALSSLLTQWQHLVEQMLETPERPWRRLDLLTPAERALLQHWNATQVEEPRESLVSFLVQQAACTPEQIALRCDERSMTYQELDARSNQLAHLLQDYGIGPERRVGISLEPSLEMVVAVLGILKAGGAYVPLDPASPPERFTFQTQDADLALLLTQERVLARLPVPGVAVLVLDQEEARLAAQPTRALVDRWLPEHIAYVLYTSGSTGQPKGVLVSQRALCNYVLWAVQAYDLQRGTGTLVHSPLTFDLTLTGLLPPLLAGQCVTLLSETQGGHALSQALRASTQLSLVKLTPTHLDLLRQTLPDTEVAGRTRALIIGGEALSGEQLSFWQRHAPETRLINEYGPTETVVGCCVYEVPAGETKEGAVPIGSPIANTHLYVLDAVGELVPLGVPGELYIGGTGVVRGYVKQPALTAERFVPDPFAQTPGQRLYRTGDRVRQQADGTLVFLGRLDQQVKIRGYRIEVGEIEATLVRHPGVREAVVVARTDHGEEARLVAYVVAQAETALTTEELRHFLEQYLPAYRASQCLCCAGALFR